MDWKKLKASVSGLITDKTSPEDAEKIAGISSQLDMAEKEEQAFTEKYDGLRAKYVDLVKNTNFPPEDQKSKPNAQEKTLEDYLKEEANKSKK